MFSAAKIRERKKNGTCETEPQAPIVCGTDFSAAATEAVDIAAAMARRLGTELVLVHVDEFYGLASARSEIV